MPQMPQMLQPKQSNVAAARPRVNRKQAGGSIVRGSTQGLPGQEENPRYSLTRRKKWPFSRLSRHVKRSNAPNANIRASMDVKPNEYSNLHEGTLGVRRRTCTGVYKCANACMWIPCGYTCSYVDWFFAAS